MIFAGVQLFVLLAAAVTFSNCAAQEADDMAESESENLPKVLDPELEKARALWQSKNIADYDMEMSAELPENRIWVRKVKIKVRGGKCTFIISADSNQTGSLTGWEGIDTVAGVFDAIQTGRNRGVKETRVEYNREYGYPEKVLPRNGGTIEIRSFKAVNVNE